MIEFDVLDGIMLLSPDRQELVQRRLLEKGENDCSDEEEGTEIESDQADSEPKESTRRKRGRDFNNKNKKEPPHTPTISNKRSAPSESAAASPPSKHTRYPSLLLPAEYFSNGAAVETAVETAQAKSSSTTATSTLANLTSHTAAAPSSSAWLNSASPAQKWNFGGTR